MKIITTLSFWRYIITGLAFVLAMHTVAWANGDPKVKVNKLDGSLGQIHKDSVLTVADSTLINTTYTAIDKLTLAIDEASVYMPDGPFAAEVSFHINAVTVSGTVEYDTTLSINYDTSGTYVHEHAFYFKDAYHVEATVTNVHTNVGWDVWKLLKVYSEISSVISYDFSCTLNAIDNITADTTLSANTTSDQLPVSWPAEVEADEYDLEWTYIDSSALASGQYGTPNPNPSLIFANNASGVTIATTSYKIPLIYDGKGRLFFRVRAVQTKPDGGRYEANWSAQSSALGHFDFNGHQRNLNWQATTTYAEEGKRKTVVQYFDGSLRNRQTVTKDNTTDTTIVAETFYDQQGRPAIQVLPAPSLENVIKYTQNFNTTLNGGEYTTDQYDALISGEQLCEKRAEGMGDNGGASQYYSPNNPNKNNGIHRFIPDAHDYPFSEVQYTPDNTGRITRQGGVGPVHQLGSGHETTYYYGTPSQEELDALFGTEAGHNSHYQKTMVKDANGQFSVSYIDMHGRTVATALAGTPTTATLDTLDSYTQDDITESLLDSTSVAIKDLVIESKKGLLVPKAALHTFTYELNPQTLSMESCNGSICYDCLYDLHITISGGCNNNSFGGQPFDTLITNFSLNSIDGNCNGTGFSVSFTKLLEEGSYEITKQLSVSRYGMDYYRDSIFMVQNTCSSMETFLNEQRTLLSIDASCKPDCETCKTSLGTWNDFRNTFLEQAGITTDTAAYTIQAWTAYQQALDNCATLCNTKTEYDDLKASLLADLTAPSGQYANVDSSANDRYSIFHSGVEHNADSIPPYTDPDITYLNEFGQPDTAYSQETGTFVIPQQLSPKEFSDKFKTSWAEALLPSHPEYCKFALFDSASAAWAKRFGTVETYQEALAKGYLNPTNGTTSPFTNYNGWGGGSHPDPDPIVNLSGYSGLQSSITNYKSVDDDAVTLSMWGAATAMVSCPQGSPKACYTNSNASPFAASLCDADLDMAWRSFREMYLNKRRELISQRLASGCNTTNHLDADLLAANHQIHFGDPTALLASNGIDVPQDENDTAAYYQSVRNRQAATYDTTCRAYATQWLNALKDCRYDQLGQDQRDTLINRLVEVCKNGSDKDHPLGSSSVAPGNTYQYKSFEEVIDQFNAAHHILASGSCNAGLITAPRPYNQQTVYSEKPLWSKPDSCECSRIKSIYDQYAIDSASYSGFSDYMQKKFQANIADSALTALMSLCDESAGPSCNYLKTPILLPAIFQCYSGSICVDCKIIDSVYALYKNKYPLALPVKSPVDSAQFSNNELFTAYLNNSLGFTKTAAEYLDFLDSCDISMPEASFSCDTLQKWLSDFQQYRGTPQLDAGGCDTTHWKLNWGNSAEYVIPVRLRDVFQNGIATLPDSTRSLPHSAVNFDYYQDLCVDSSGFTFETRVKIPDSTIIPNGYNSSMWLWLENKENTGAGSLLTGFGLGNGIGFCSHARAEDPKRICSDYPTTILPTLNDWRVIKIQLRGRQCEIFLDDTLLMQTTLDTPFTHFTGWSVGPFSLGGQIDYVKIYDTAGNYLYNENFDGCDQLAVAHSNCGACTSEFTDYFNQNSGGNYTAQQVRDIYRNSCNTILPADCTTDSLEVLTSEFEKYHGVPHLDAGGSDTTHWKIAYGAGYGQAGNTFQVPVVLKDAFNNGYAHIPDTTSHTSGDPVSFNYFDDICVDSAGFDFNFRIKIPDSTLLANKNLSIEIGTADPSPRSLEFQYFLNSTTDLSYCHLKADGSVSCAYVPITGRSFNDFKDVQVKVRLNDIQIFVNGALTKSASLEHAITKINWLKITAWSHDALIDYFRVTDLSGKTILAEEFNSASNLAVPNSLCNGNCIAQFTDYYNESRGTSYTYSQIDSIYNQQSLPLNVCEDSVVTYPERMLCGTSTPVVSPVDITDFVTSCSDSSFFIYSNAAELYKVYTDSLMGDFDTHYRDKCMQAYKYETFTVSHAESEYHYTLYYYDQAGNLVKTIPPKGVHPNRSNTWLEDVKAKRASGQRQVPTHDMPTQYRYNTLNQVVAQQTPDAGKSEFWYDRLGRLALSQNAKQKAVSATAANRLYSYTKYDALGRITEVGQINDNTGATTVSDALTRNTSSFQSWLTARDDYRGQITTTIYDEPYGGFTGIDARLILQQRNLRNRVSYTMYSDTLNNFSFNQATFYSYDIHGNVDTLLQDYGVTDQYPNVMNKNYNRYKKIGYNYDLISGKVNKVSYQKGWADQVFHRYSYDAENRLTDVETSFDDRNWEKEARYEYYQHGPLARVVLGGQQVQGTDYAYTLQGWLKGVNSMRLSSATDIGEDGLAGGAYQYVARDAVGFYLNYYDTSDYAAISGDVPFPGMYAYMPSANYRPLFNGNISSMAINNRALGDAGGFGGALMLYAYRYDQLNRLTEMDAFKNLNTTGNTWNGLTGMDQYRETITYDGNGNILTYNRNGHKAAYLMDLLTYTYNTNTNQLNRVQDGVTASKYGSDPGDVEDVDNQQANNYTYDEIGNMIRDVEEGITSIKWSVYGKILEINRSSTTANPVQKISYTYDASGNRISKTVQKNNGSKTYTWYVRDAQGNVMATYSSHGSAEDLNALPLVLSERHLYGSSRLGMYTGTVNVDEGPRDMADSNGVKYYRGFRQYELSNHLGNVLATISDKKKPVDANSDGTIDYFDADVVTAQDYYPFGMLMPGRVGYWSASGWSSQPGEPAPDHGLEADIAIDARDNNQPPEYTATRSVELTQGFESGAADEFTAYISPAEEGGGGGDGSGSSSLNGGYRYGFNGKENDNEVKGTGNQQDYGMRIYDPRLGRFLSVDPLTKSFPTLTPYQFSSNSPIANVDLDGGESKYYSIELSSLYNGNGKLLKTNSRMVEEKSRAEGWFINGKPYQFAGNLGNGTLYTITSAKTILKDNGVQEIVIQNVGAIYVPPPPKPVDDRPVSKMPYNIIVFGSGSNPEESLGSKPNPNAKTITFDYEKFQELVEPILIAQEQPMKIPEKIEKPTLYDLILHAGEIGLDNAVEKLKSERRPDNSENYQDNPGFIFKRLDDYGREKKGSIQNHAYFNDTFEYKPAKEGSVDTFYIKQKRQ
jgi:RHS repeat-associated protein